MICASVYLFLYVLCVYGAVLWFHLLTVICLLVSRKLHFLIV